MTLDDFRRLNFRGRGMQENFISVLQLFSRRLALQVNQHFFLRRLPRSFFFRAYFCN